MKRLNIKEDTSGNKTDRNVYRFPDRIGAGEAELGNDTDAALMARYRKGDAAAFDVLFQRHNRGVYAFVLGYLHNRQAAEDTLQEVFMRVIRSRGSYEPSAKFTTWLYRIARNLCIDAHRRRKGLTLVPLEGDSNTEERDNAPSTRLASKAPSPQEEAAAAEMGKLVQQALERINPEQREVFLLRQEGLAFEEIAAITGTGKNTVKSRMRYALEALRLALGNP